MGRGKMWGGSKGSVHVYLETLSFVGIYSIAEKWVSIEKVG